MIRIDEIYNNTFWPWLRKNLLNTRIYYCDPPGQTTANTLFNVISNTAEETGYIFFHDQEPIWLDLHLPLFNELILRNANLYQWNNMSDVPDSLNQYMIKEFKKYGRDTALRKNINSVVPYLKKHPHCTPTAHLIVSEQGEFVEQLCRQYNWKSHYYFYHGWACQDWFRGYDKTFLIPRARDRSPTKTFISPNRIVGGKRDHRVLFLYQVFKQKLEHNHISAPKICQYENTDIIDVANRYCNIYPDIGQVFDNATLPRLFAGEETQQMTSCWLSNFAEAQDSLVYVPTETVYFGRRTHITEKTFKAIALEMPFVLLAPAGSLEYMRSYGFKTFSSVFDESYDEETNDIQRVEKVANLLKNLDELTVKEKQHIHRACLSIVEHNYNHFYKGGLTDILWAELINMLNGLKL
jgi:hypothetical protein